MPISIIRNFLVRAILVVAAVCAGQNLAVGQVNLNPQEQAIFNMMANDGGQRRPFLKLDPTLCRVARARAADMAARHYYSHTDPDGHGPNWWVEQAGYTLPAHYNHSGSGNNIESLTAGRSAASDAYNSWIESSAHREHILATNAFYAEQTSVGVGYVHSPGSEWTDYWVVLTAPPSGATVSISSPAANAKLPSSQVSVSGVTSGAPAPASVQARVENTSGNGAWVTASGIANWSVTLDGLQPGENVLRVRALDASGTPVDNDTRTVKYVEMTPLTVQVNGSGSVTEGFAGTTQREVGRSYTITATPAAGFIFSGWTGSATSSNPNLTFTMATGYTLSANFVPNPFVQSAGRYLGLFTGGSVHGFIKVKVDATGAFTVRVKYNGTAAGIAGKFKANGDATVSTLLPSGATLTASLHLNAANGTITGSISDGTFTADLSVGVSGNLNGGTSPYAGRYTVVLPAAADSTSATPDGDGYAVLVVTPTGTATLAGVLAEGTPFLSGGSVSTSGQLVLYTPLYTGAGLLTGTLNIRSTSASDLDGQLFWSKPAQSGTVCPGAFALTLQTVGSRYNVPAPGQPGLQVAATANNTALELGDGGLTSPIVKPATLTADNAVSAAAPVVPGSAKLKPNNGRFVGQFVHPVTGAPTKFRGVIFQKQNAGFGFFLGSTTSGYTTFTPSGS